MPDIEKLIFLIISFLLFYLLFDKILFDLTHC